VKTARFSEVVEKCGRPVIHIILMDPATDRVLQSAVKADRVMTVFQQAAGTRADRGVVGFEPGGERQFLVFPKSLRAYAGRSIIGIKYDLLKTEDVAKPRRVTQPREREHSRRDPKTRRASLPANVVAFRRDAGADGTDERDEKERAPQETKERQESSANAAAGDKPADLGAEEARESETKGDAGEENAGGGAEHEAFDEGEEMIRIRKQIRKAMEVLEQGRPVAAYNILKAIVDT
jgi:hypothetical protein